VQRKLYGGGGEENYCNQSKDNYRGPSTTPLRGFAQDDGEKQTKATARAKARNKQRQEQEQSQKQVSRLRDDKSRSFAMLRISPAGSDARKAAQLEMT